MRDFHIDLIWTKIQIAITALGGWLGYARVPAGTEL